MRNYFKILVLLSCLAFSLTSCVKFTPSPTQIPPQQITGYFKIVNVLSGKVLDGRGYTQSASAVMQYSPDEGSPNQIWDITLVKGSGTSEAEDSDLQYLITNFETDLVLSLSDDTRNVIQIISDPASAENNKTVWKIEGNAEDGFTIQSLANSLYLGNSGSMSDRRVSMDVLDGSDGQVWMLEKVDDDLISVLKPEIEIGTMYFPGKDWIKCEPEDEGMSAAKLDEIDSFLANSGKYEILSLVVSRYGVIVYEKYWEGKDKAFVFPVYSVSKSFTSAMVGVSVHDGFITSLDEPVIPSYFAGYEMNDADPRKNEITLADLLTMRHGFAWTDNEDYYPSVTGDISDSSKVILDTPMAADPGTIWNYHTGIGLILNDIIGRASGKDVPDYYDTGLFGPTGITSAKWQLDSRGIPLGGIGLSLTARDMLRLGHLYLNNGVWNGTRIIDEAYIIESTSSKCKTGWKADYGYQWFVREDLGSYYALGSRGQFLIVIPSQNIVIAINSNDYSGDMLEIIINGVVKEYILPAIID